VLDVGAGPGYAAAMLASRVAERRVRWLLIDPQREMWAAREAPLQRIAPGFRPDWVEADGTALPVRDGSVDVVLSLGVLCCMSEAAVPAASAELRRVLRPGGLLLLQVPRRRGGVDAERLHRDGLEVVARDRPGSVLFRKPL
jgi:malonyl-CoA O-methyltransferase